MMAEIEHTFYKTSEVKASWSDKTYDASTALGLTQLVLDQLLTLQKEGAARDPAYLQRDIDGYNAISKVKLAAWG